MQRKFITLHISICDDAVELNSFTLKIRRGRIASQPEGNGVSRRSGSVVKNKSHAAQCKQISRAHPGEVGGIIILRMRRRRKRGHMCSDDAYKQTAEETERASDWRRRCFWMNFNYNGSGSGSSQICAHFCA